MDHHAARQNAAINPVPVMPYSPGYAAVCARYSAGFACFAILFVLLSGFALAQNAHPVPASTTSSPAPSLVVGTDAHLVADGDRVRLTIALSSPVAVPVRTQVLSGPDRIVIDLPEINFQIPTVAGRKAAGFVPGYRFGLVSPGRSRIVLDLSEPALVTSADITPKNGGFGELSIILRRTDKASFQASVLRPEMIDKPVMPDEPRGPSNASRSDKRPVVVIDPGHGGVDPGAASAEVAEKAIVLAFGLALRDRLLEGGHYSIVMTRDDDRFISLGDRVSAARAAGADLFISIHADSLSQAQDVRGATVYTGSDRATDNESARLAAKENAADSAAGIDQREKTEEVSGILMDLARRETKVFSSAFARTLVDKMGNSIRMHRIPLRSAGFRVLGAPDIPSVLIELGYVTSSRDIELLTSEAWRRGAAHSVAAAVDSFFKNRRSPLMGASVTP